MSLLPWLQPILVVLLLGLIYASWAKIPSRQKQREEGERILAQRAFKDSSEVRKAFRGYFARLLKLLVSMSLALFTVNALMALVLYIFIMSNPNDPVFTKVPDWPALVLPPWAAAIGIAFMMCSAAWLMMISYVYHSRATKLFLEIKYEEFLRD